MKPDPDLTEIFEEIRQEDEKNAEDFWNKLSYDDKCNAFHAVVSRIHKGEIEKRGSYRYVLYDLFEFGPDMYMRGMNCGYMDLHNNIVDKKDK